MAGNDMQNIIDLREALTIARNQRTYRKVISRGMRRVRMNRNETLESVILYLEARLAYEHGSDICRYHGQIAS